MLGGPALRCKNHFVLHVRIVQSYAPWPLLCSLVLHCPALCSNVQPVLQGPTLCLMVHHCALLRLTVRLYASRCSLVLHDPVLCSDLVHRCPTLCPKAHPWDPVPIHVPQCPSLCPRSIRGPRSIPVPQGPSLCPTVHSCNPRFSHALSSPVFQDPPYVPMSSLVLKGPALCSMIQPCVQKSSIVLSGPALCSKVQP